MELKTVIKGFFTGKTKEILSLAATSKKQLYIPFGLANVLAVTLLILLVPVQLLNGITATLMGGPVVIKISVFLNTGLFAGKGLVFSILAFLIICAACYLICLIHKQKIGIVTILNIVSVALLPATVMFAIGILLGFALYPLSVLFILIGCFTSIFMIYEGIDTVLENEEIKIIWSMGILLAVLFAVVLGFIFIILMPQIIHDILGASEEIVDKVLSPIREMLDNIFN